jgi:hypothetical protein
MQEQKPQMSSCFLLAMQDDSIDGIYDTLKQTAKSLNQQVEWDFLFTMFVQQVLTFVEQMEHQMVLFYVESIQ